MKVKYYIYGIGYDKNNCVTDYNQFFGIFDNYVDAYESFVKLQCRNPETFFINKNNIYQMLLQIEECEKINGEITCIDVRNEWWIINPNFNFNQSLIAKDYNQEALLYAEKHGIIEYYVKNNKMIYYSSFPMEHKTVRAIVNLDTLKEHRRYLSKYYRAYDKKVGGKIQANYCI